MRIYSLALIAFIKKKALTVSSTKELVVLVNKRFGIELSYNQMRGIKRYYGIFSGKAGRQTIFSPQIIDFMKERAPYVTYKGLKNMVNSRFKTRYTTEQIRNGRKNHVKLPKKRFPLLTEIIDNQGYLNIKVSTDSLIPKENWKRKHIWIWEKVNGPVPNGHVLIFLDGCKTNCVIENLALVSKGEHALLNQFELRFKDPEMTKKGIKIARHRLAVCKQIKERRNNNERICCKH